LIGGSDAQGNTTKTSHSPSVPTAYGGRDVEGGHGHSKTRAKARAEYRLRRE